MVESNFFSHPDDLHLTIAVIHVAREALATWPAADLYCQEMSPGEGTDEEEHR